MKKMYFIAIYPPEEIIEEIKAFKRDMAVSYGNSKALKMKLILLFSLLFPENWN
jgi:2'-5' RNA ligase